MNLQYGNNELWMPGVGSLHRIRRFDDPDEGDTNLPYANSTSYSHTIWSMGPLTQNQQHDLSRGHINMLYNQVSQQNRLIRDLERRIENLEMTSDEFDNRLINILYMMLPDHLTARHTNPMPRQADVNAILRSITRLTLRLDDSEAFYRRHLTQIHLELSEVFTRARSQRDRVSDLFDPLTIPSSVPSRQQQIATEFISTLDPVSQREYCWKNLIYDY